MAKTAVISGANGALGSKIVAQFLKNGYEVEGLYRSEPKQSVDGVHHNIVDLLDEGAVARTVENIISRKGKIDVLVCTAGGFASGNVEKTDTHSLQKQYQINFLTAYNLVRPTYLDMKKSGYGRIFLIGSRQGLDSKQALNAVAYGLSKSLLFHLAEILNKDNPGNVVTTMIVPSTIDTPDNRKWSPEADFSKWVAPEDIAQTILFYCSEAADTIREPIVKTFGEA